MDSKKLSNLLHLLGTIGLILLMVLVVVFPSPKVSYFVQKRPQLEFPKEIIPGEVIIIPRIKGIASIEYAGRPLTLVNNDQSWLIMPSVHDGKYVTISGLWENSSSKLIDKILGSPKLYFRETLPIRSFTLKQAQNLRIPASVWNETQNEEQQRRAQEREQMNKILSSGTSKIINEGCWRLPLDSEVTSLFGSPRTLPNGQRYHHSGVDLRARSPQPIYAMGEGNVVYAGRMVVPGNLVVIDHGGYLHSRYLHMSRIMVEEGQKVTPNTLLGFTGATGRITGPHLHWELLWHGRSGNPLSIFSAWKQIKDCEMKSKYVFSSYAKKAEELNRILFAQSDESDELGTEEL